MDEILKANPGSLKELISLMTPNVYESVKTAIEIGKWHDGTRLNQQQGEHCMQILILYEARYLPEESHTTASLPGCLSNKDSY